MRHEDDQLLRQHQFTLSYDECERLSSWSGSEFVEPGMNIIREFIDGDPDTFMSRLSHARLQRRRNHRRRFGCDMPAPMFYLVQRGSLTQEEKHKLMNAGPCDVIEVQNMPRLERVRHA